MIKRYNVFIVIVLLWIISVFSIIMSIVNSYDIIIQNYLGFGLLILVTVLWIYKIKKIKTIVGVLLLLGSINGIQFTYFKSTIIFTRSPMGNNFSSLGIQPLSILLLILFIIANRSDFMRLMINLFSEDPKITQEKHSRLIARHYDELKIENNSKLQDIIDNKSMYRIEYVKAAKKLMNERIKE